MPFKNKIDKINYNKNFYKIYYQKNKEKVLKESKDYYMKNRKKVIERQKQTNKKNKDKKREYDKKRNINFRNEKKKYASEYYRKNKEKIIMLRKKYYTENKDKLQQLRSKIKARRERDFNFIQIFVNPFPEEIKVDYHHINNLLVIPLPHKIHFNNLGKNHREKCNIAIQNIYGLDFNQLLKP